MKKCSCLSAPKYHRSDCPFFDEWGNVKNNFRRNEQVLHLYRHLQKLVSHLVILEEDNRYYFFEVAPDPSRFFETSSAALVQNKKYSNRFENHCCSFEPQELKEMLERLSGSRIPYKIYKFDGASAQLITL